MNWKVAVAGIFIVTILGLVGNSFFKPMGFKTGKKKHYIDGGKFIMEDKHEAKETGRDGSFVAYNNGVVYDTRTGLEWFAGPDKNVNWKKAKFWAENLDAAGGGWRLPICNELKTLFRKGAGAKDISPLSRNMTSLFKVRGQYIWSGEIGKIKGSIWSRWDAEYFNFNFDGFSASDLFWFSSDFRSFAVRTRQTQTLMTAAHQRDIAAVKAFLNTGADVNAKDKDGHTVLMMAVKYSAFGQEKGVEQYKIVQLLVEKGADVNAKQKDGFTALKYAKKNNSAQVIKILKQNGATE
jgi:hypothetical protein